MHSPLAIPALRLYTKVLDPFEVIFVCSRRYGSYSILLYLEIQFSLSHLMKKLFCLCVFKNLLPMCIYFDTFVKKTISCSSFVGLFLGHLFSFIGWHIFFVLMPCWFCACLSSVMLGSQKNYGSQVSPYIM